MAGKILRAGVVGASTLLGKELVSEINDSAAAAWDLTLLDASEDSQGQLTSAGDEAYVIHALSKEAVSGLDVVFFADQVALTEEFGKHALEGGAAVVDLTGAMRETPGFLLRSPWLEAGVRPDLTTVGIVTPHPAGLMLALVAERLGRRFGKVDIAATVLEPASQAGAAGVDELHQQTVSLLSFQELPKKVFDAQVAFNVQGALGDEGEVRLAETRERIRKDAFALLGADFGAEVDVNVLQAPVFHGYVISAHVKCAQPASQEDLRAALPGVPVAADDELRPSNQAAAESGDLLVSVRRSQNEGSGAWVLLAADNLRLAARNAVGAALELAALRPGTRVQ
jgi:aspartate-semialdehyde dehydrogenase